jgi:hypothetical protein
MIARFALNLAVILAFSAACTSCLFNSKSDRVVDPDAERRVIAFESDDALLRFHGTVNRRYSGGKNFAGESQFAIPFVVAVEERHVLSENAFFNQEVARADLNGDGSISDIESRAYESTCPPPSASK